MKLFSALVTFLLGMLISAASAVPLKNKVAQSKSEFPSAYAFGSKLTLQVLRSSGQKITDSSNFKSYIVSFSDTVSTSVVDSALQKVRETDGTITHVFNLINGFLAIASEDAMQTISTLSEGITVEEDQVVTTNT